VEDMQEQFVHVLMVVYGLNRASARLKYGVYLVPRYFHVVGAAAVARHEINELRLPKRSLDLKAGEALIKHRVKKFE
jgi:hypothetical protein